MNIDDVVHDFAVAGDDLPRDSMRWALDNWDAALPRFIELLDRYADGVDRSQETTDALFFAVHLIGEKRADSAFPALCRLCADAPVDEAFGDAVAQNFAGILISAYNGDASHLERIIEAPDADETARLVALEAMAYLAGHGAIHEDAMRSYLLRLFEEMPRHESFMWSTWALAVANLGYEDFSPKVDDLFRRGFIADWDMDRRDFDKQLRITLRDPERKAGFKADRIGPFEDAIGVLSKWHGFSDQHKADKARDLAEEPNFEKARLLAEMAATFPSSILSTPAVNIHRDVGRNDPCPCGSGKKYKKCCLAAERD